MGESIKTRPRSLFSQLRADVKIVITRQNNHSIYNQWLNISTLASDENHILLISKRNADMTENSKGKTVTIAVEETDGNENVQSVIQEQDDVQPEEQHLTSKLNDETPERNAMNLRQKIMPTPAVNKRRQIIKQHVINSPTDNNFSPITRKLLSRKRHDSSETQ